MTRIITFYLPQYYAFPENDEWWGAGFTEWTNVRKSTPLYKGHYQPTVPLHGNYYSLNDKKTMSWQVALAKRYGIYGFCFYHYWFGRGRQLMEKPVEAFLADSSLDLPFCLCWANHNWTRTWQGGDHEILMEMDYGDASDWESHFEYLLPFFLDKRYIRIGDKPILLIYLPQDVECLAEMLSCFDSLANQAGLAGITYIAQHCFDLNNPCMDLLDYAVWYEPNCVMRQLRAGMPLDTARVFPVAAANELLRMAKSRIKQMTHGMLSRVVTRDYDSTWEYILHRRPESEKIMAGAFVNCDVTPRRGDRAVLFKGAEPEKFERYLTRLLLKVNEEFSTDYVFLSAWNEWGEGMYLEPDELHGYKYLEAVQVAQLVAEEWDCLG